MVYDVSIFPKEELISYMVAHKLEESRARFTLDRFSGDKGFMLVHHDGDTFCGTAMVASDTGVPCIRAITASSNEVGQELLHACLDKLRGAGHPKAYYEVPLNDLAKQALLQRQGWYFVAHNKDTVRMAKVFH